MTLKELRESHYKTQIEVAAHCHVAPTTVSKWENGVQNPRLNQIVEMAELFNVSPQEVDAAIRDSRK